MLVHLVAALIVGRRRGVATREYDVLLLPCSYTLALPILTAMPYPTARRAFPHSNCRLADTGSVLIVPLCAAAAHVT